MGQQKKGNRYRYLLGAGDKTGHRQANQAVDADTVQPGDRVS